MASAFNFNINSNLQCSQLSKSIGAYDFLSLCDYIKNIPYGRTTDRSNYKAIITENSGTCSTKHAFLKAVAIENKQQSISLFIGIYKMKDTNTNGVGSVLNTHNLEYIPEAHTYIKINDKTVDITRNQVSQHSFEKDLLTEIEIMPKQIGDFKLQLHQNYIKQWLDDNNYNITFKSLWNIREACILALSK